ncbi:DNA helicase [Sporosarcina sp. P12(2017)]|uniref:replicative DNA helicase n=1 Tax=unclassified Sporosarcina TaxID=2647733 RepID=UPI000C16DCCA|nr:MULTISPECIES: DnaB-like helicase C-terminal domain-containing protein [unclassified Sporosarcina]PIC57993.1 DNA helicase [Sporosarcina sp. P10]PIC61376.1 DNA helicase [Sporosarcina sp. P12(2017)]
MNSELMEKSLLGTMMEENYLVLDSGIQTAFFEKQLHKNIYLTMKELANNGRPIDFITLLTTREPAELGGANYVSELRRFANPARFDEYLEMVITKWKKREMERILQQAQVEQWELNDVFKELEKLDTDYTSDDSLLLDEILVAQYERPFIEASDMTGISTGLQPMDYLLNGFQDSEFIVIAARPSMGKTDTLNHLALTAGWNNHLPIVFSLEMSRKSMTERLISAAGGYSRLKMRDPYKHFDNTQKDTWMTALEHLQSAKIRIDDRSGIKVSQIKATARKIIREQPDKRPIIFVDYLQIIRPEETTNNQNQAIGQISSDLKTMAKEFNCPVVVLSQLSRAVEQRQDKQPMMSDLRDSGNIEQDADVVCFLYREDYYDQESELKNHLEITVAKHRNGPVGGFTVYYNKDNGRLSSIR